ncbi:MAG: hypothetical protein OEZ43_03305 [Gammaproteobacteria bacterium]|nr:hypothetical protein [Gammaproteobacteria bacterium]
MKIRCLSVAFAFVAILSLAGCATSIVKQTHPLYAAPSDAYAEVVFFRPMPRRTRGVADNDVTIEVDKQEMLKLSAGEYVVLRLKPSEVEVTMRNMTYLTYRVMPEEVYRARRISFEANKTYYIQAMLKVEEFRGYYFVPQVIEEEQGKQIVRQLKPVTQPVG